jgi:hypothetical protein
MKSVARIIVFAAIAVLAGVSILAEASDRHGDFAARESVETLDAARPRRSDGSGPAILTSSPIKDLGLPEVNTYNIWSLTMAPGANADTVYLGTSRSAGTYGKLYGYDPHGDQFFKVDSLYGESFRCLVTRYDTIWGGTGIDQGGGSACTGGRFFKFYPPDDSIESIGIPIPGDSMIESVTFGVGITDTGWIFGGTGPAGLDPAHTGGGSLFAYIPSGGGEVTGFYVFGEMVDGMKLVKVLTPFYYSNTDTGSVFGGTGLDNAYTFIQVGGDNMSRSPETVELAQGGSQTLVGGLCTVYPDTIYGCTLDSACVFEFIASTDQYTRLGFLYSEAETPLSSGPMVKQGGADSLIYIAALMDTVSDPPHFYEYNRTKEIWAPGPASNPLKNPRYWELPTDSVYRIRSLAVDSTDSHVVYIGGGSQGRLLVFNPKQASQQTQQSSKLRKRHGGNRGIVFSCQPSPFTKSLRLEYRLPEGHEGQVTVAIYDVAGRPVKRMPRGRRSGSVVWRGRDDLGDRVRPGVYFCRLTASGIAETRKVVLVR